MRGQNTMLLSPGHKRRCKNNRHTGEKRKAWTLLMPLVMAVIALAGCQGAPSGQPNSGATSGAPGRVVIAGSTSVQPLAEMLAEAYMEKNPGVSIEVQGGGSGQGVKAIKEGIADFGALSRPVKATEKAIAQVEYTIALDGIAIVAHQDTNVTSLTLEQLRDIFTGQITNWQSVGGDNRAIVVVAREEGSGTRGAFGELTGVIGKNASGKDVDRTVATALVQGSTGAVLQTVAQAEGAIGYVSLGSLSERVRALPVAGVAATVETVTSGRYALARPFIFIAGGSPAPAAQAFLDFILSQQGQKLIQEAGFIPTC